MDEDKIIGISQGWKMMKCCVGNARTRPVGNAVMITKQESGPAKIDPLMALFDAASIMAQNVTKPQVFNLKDV